MFAIDGSASLGRRLRAVGTAKGVHFCSRFWAEKIVLGHRFVSKLRRMLLLNGNFITIGVSKVCGLLVNRDFREKRAHSVA